MLNVWIHTFANDSKVHIALLLVIADFIFGVGDAVKKHNFRFSYVADFARNDLLFKLVPYFVLYVFALVAGNENLVIPGLDFGVLAGAAYVALVAAWTASILNSLAGIGLGGDLAQNLNTRMKVALFADENAAPPKD